MSDIERKKLPADSEKLVTAPARSLESKESLAVPNPYTTDWTDMSDMTRKLLALRGSQQ